ncbi:MAG: hypothetical protein AB7S39_15660 [Gemmatimonadales bacterium]
MIVRSTLAALMGLVGTTAPVAAQQPDLAGTWVVEADPADARSTVASAGDAAFRTGTAGSGWGSPLTIARTATALTVEYQVFVPYDLQPPLQYRFALDGSLSTNSIMVSHTAVPIAARLTRSGADVVIASTYPGPPDPQGRPTTVAVRQTLRLAAPNRLLIETVRDGILGAAPVTTRTFYTRK